MFTNRTSLIIPTKNRSEQLIKLLNRIKSLNFNFNEILIIDSSNNFHSDKISFQCKKEILNILKQNLQHLSKEIWY